MIAKNLFDSFKKEKKTVSHLPAKKENIFFVLLFDNKGAFIEIRNEKGNETDPDYEQYSGATKNIVKAVQGIKEKASLIIDWENEESRVYLYENDYLIPLLLESKLWITEPGEVLALNKEKGELFLVLEPTENSLMLNTNLEVALGEQRLREFKFITENYILLHNLVIEIPDVGQHFRSMGLFNTTIGELDLPKFFSLFFSFVKNVEVEFSDYTVVHNPEKIETSPVLVFEKIDQDDTLYLRITQMLPGIESDLLSDYDLSYHVFMNDIERQIEVKPIESINIESTIREIEKMVQKHIPKEGKKKTEEVVLEGETLIIPRETASGFIYKDLPNLLSTFKIIGAEKLKSYKISTLRPRLDIKLNHGIDFFEGEASLHFADERFTLFDALQQYQKNRYILLSDGTHAIVNEAYMDKLKRLFNKKKDNVTVSFFDLPLVEDLLDEKITSTSFKKTKAIFEGFNKIDSSKGSIPKIKAKLRPYQEYGYKWLDYLHKNNLGGCLADDMGLGKTLQTITLLASIYPAEKMPSLVVLPKSLLYNWENELRKFAPNITNHTYYGTERNLEMAMLSNVILTTYATIRNDVEELKEIDFYYVILDESQNIKNILAQTTKAVMLLKTKHRLALSGTPIENNLGELYSLFRFLNPAMFGSIESFNQSYLVPIQKYNDKEITQELRKKIYPFMLRRLKKDVLPELPDKIEQVLYVEMTDAQQKLYEQRRLFYKESINQQIANKGLGSAHFFVFQALNELRQIASTPESMSNGQIESPKIELLLEQLLDAVANNHKVLVFVNYLIALELIGEKLEAQGIDFVSMSGSTKNRQQLVDKFQNDKSCKVFLLTLKTGGTGLNLTAADTVFIFDPWWNKAAENQAIDRTHRMGQVKKVLCYKMITQKTIEEKILLLQEQKSEVFNNIIGQDSASLKVISEDDIQFMLS